MILLENELDDLRSNKIKCENIIKDLDDMKSLKNNKKQETFKAIIISSKKAIDDFIQKIFSVDDPIEIDKVNKTLNILTELLKEVKKKHEDNIRLEKEEEDGNFSVNEKKNKL